MSETHTARPRARSSIWIREELEDLVRRDVPLVLELDVVNAVAGELHVEQPCKARLPFSPPDSPVLAQWWGAVRRAVRDWAPPGRCEGGGYRMDNFGLPPDVMCWYWPTGQGTKLLRARIVAAD